MRFGTCNQLQINSHLTNYHGSSGRQDSVAGMKNGQEIIELVFPEQDREEKALGGWEAKFMYLDRNISGVEERKRSGYNCRREKEVTKPRVDLPLRSPALLDLAGGHINCKEGLGRLFVSRDLQEIQHRGVIKDIRFDMVYNSENAQQYEFC